MSAAVQHAARRPSLLTRAFARVVARELSKGGAVERNRR
jgi:hypothetical protein